MTMNEDTSRPMTDDELNALNDSRNWHDTTNNPRMSREEFFRIPRNYFCRKCGLTVMSAGLPVGWLLMLVGKGGGDKPAQIGVYCGFLCVIEDCFHAVRRDITNMKRAAFAALHRNDDKVE